MQYCVAGGPQSNCFTNNSYAEDISNYKKQKKVDRFCAMTQAEIKALEMDNK